MKENEEVKNSEKELILVVEDFDRLNNYIVKNLQKNGYEAVQCLTEKQAYKELQNNYFSLVILDLNLGENSSGMKILRYIRLQNKILPVIIISSSNDDKTKIEGFREGCDDFITKPFFIDELIYRVKRSLEKLSYMSFEKKTVSLMYKNGIFEIDLERGIVLKNGVEICMRKKQFDLMLYFIQNPTPILSFQAISQNVWQASIPQEKILETNIYVNIRSLRALIEEDKNNPKHIVSVSKSGYIFIPEV